MCFSSRRQFFYFGGAFDLSWLPWTAINIAPDDRRRRGVTPGRRRRAKRASGGARTGAKRCRGCRFATSRRSLGIAPFYFDWLDHPDDGPYWHFADIESQAREVRVPIFNFSGWHDEGYGPIGATRNFTGLRARGGRPRRARRGSSSARGCTAARHRDRVGDRDFGDGRGLDYDALVLDWCDLARCAASIAVGPSPPVRLFVMGAQRWRDAPDWPLAVDAARVLPARRRPAHDRGAGRAARRRHLHVRSERSRRRSALRRRARPARSARDRSASRRAGRSRRRRSTRTSR